MTFRPSPCTSKIRTLLTYGYDKPKSANIALLIIREVPHDVLRVLCGGRKLLAASTKSPHVPSQYYGYSLQCTHCVYLLLDAQPGSRVSVEVLEDVAVEDESGEVEAVQLKSAAKTNPISNRSVELWKTIRNWIQAVESTELVVENTIFHLRLGRERSGTICKSFAGASTLQNAGLAIEKAKAEFFTKNGKIKKGVPHDLSEIVEIVFAPARSDLTQRIISRFQLSFGTKYAFEELLGRLKTKFIDEDVAEDVLLHALGWVKKEIDNAMEHNELPLIAVDKFRTEMAAFRDRLKARSYLPSFAGPPSLEEIELHKLRVFVRQLNLVNFSEEHILRGITDFLSARTNRIQYAKRGYVHSESFVEFESALMSLWQNHRDEIELNQTEEEITRGRRLAFRCLRESLKLQGIDVPADFVRGCFHSLADEPSIGWHPRFEILLADTSGGQ